MSWTTVVNDAPAATLNEYVTSGPDAPGSARKFVLGFAGTNPAPVYEAV